MDDFIRDLEAHDESALFYKRESFLRRVLEIENDRRMSPDIQEKYRIAEESDTEDWLEVTDQLQRDILKENSVGDADIEGALLALRTATYVYPQLATIPVYRKYQRAREGDLQEGCPAPQVSSLLSINGEKVSLVHHDDNDSTFPMLVCAGSIS